MKKIYLLIFITLFFTETITIATPPKTRTTYNYELKDSYRVVYKGVTNNPERRLGEHIRSGKKCTHMRIVGKVKTDEGARNQERNSLKTYRDSHRGKNPKYNKTDHG